MRKIMIIMTGPSCAGKSSVKKILHAKIAGSYEVSFDTLKWGLSGYDRETDGPLVRRLLLGYIDLVAQEGVPIISESAFKLESELAKLFEIVNHNDYQLIIVRIEAPREVLIGRFRERLAGYHEKGGKMSVMSEDMFIKNMDESRYHAPENAWTFDSSLQTAEEIADEIIHRALSL